MNTLQEVQEERAVQRAAQVAAAAAKHKAKKPKVRDHLDRSPPILTGLEGVSKTTLTILRSIKQSFSRV